ncbi:MAG TPA: RodZ domain-containing protein [Xanthomonadales bacterium]|nr:RodZ domain-containing protein [Xanthomonadales bacterium]
MTTEEQNELIPMGIGDLLLEAREKKGLTIEESARAVKVKPDVLRAIESGEMGHIPSVYLKGYIRSYARYLGLSLSSIEQKIADASGAEPAVQTIFKEGLPRHSGERWIKSSSYVIASAVVIALVWQFTNEAVRFSQGDPMLRPAPEKSAAAQSQLNEGSGPGNTSPSDAALKHPPSNTHLRASIASMNSLVGQEQGTRSLAAEEARSVIDDTASPDNLASTSSGLDALEIVTSADSWIEIVDGNGNRIEMDLLRAGSRRNYQAEAPFSMLLGRASSVEVFHNGEKVDLGPYTRGNVARITLGGPDPVTEMEPETQPDSPAENDAMQEQG